MVKSLTTNLPPSKLLQAQVFGVVTKRSELVSHVYAKLEGECPQLPIELLSDNADPKLLASGSDPQRTQRSEQQQLMFVAATLR